MDLSWLAWSLARAYWALWYCWWISGPAERKAQLGWWVAGGLVAVFCYSFTIFDQGTGREPRAM